MTETLIGTYSKRLYADREAASLMQDMPEGVTIVLRINDDATWSLFESVEDEALTGDEAIVAEAVSDWQAGHPLQDGQARVIASQWHGGQTSPLYMLASTGTVRESVVSNVEREIDAVGPLEAEASGLEALLAYCERVGSRGPVDGWSNAWGKR